MQLSVYVLPIFWLEVLIAVILFIPIWDTSKRNLALMMSRQSFLPKLKYGIYIVALFLVFSLFASWRESGISAAAGVRLLQKARAEYEFILTFSTLVIGPFMWRYFAVMSEMRRLEKSDIAMKRQAQQINTMVLSLIDKNDKLKKTNKKWEELSLKKVSLSSGEVNMKEDEGNKNGALIRKKVTLEKENEDLDKELEETKKNLHRFKQASIQEAVRQSKTQETLQKELEGYKLMVFKSKVS